MVRGGAASSAIAPLLFLCAVLSKEAAVAMPVAAGAFAVFHQRAGTGETARRIAPWLAALAVYAVLRSLGGGVSAIGGAARLPKLAALVAMLGVLLLLADGRWLALRAWLRERRGVFATTAALTVASASAIAAWQGGTGLVADKLAVAGFALFHLGSPLLDVFDAPFYEQPGTSMYWLGGAIALAMAATLVALVWRVLLDDDRAWFAGAFLAAALLPISALTEGARYLYLPSAALSLLAGLLLTHVSIPARKAAVAATAAVIVVSAVQAGFKVRDWIWAGRMTADGARLVDESLAPGCGGHVIFLTSPVGIRSVYTHFYYETFELPRGCMPETFHVLARVMRHDVVVDARWSDPSTIVITAPAYRGTFVLARDLRHFDVPLRDPGSLALATPLGEVRADRDGDTQRLTLSLAPDVLRTSPRVFYYSGGRILPLAK
jgi:hypothetical protein